MAGAGNSQLTRAVGVVAADEPRGPAQVQAAQLGPAREGLALAGLLHVQLLEQRGHVAEVERVQAAQRRQVVQRQRAQLVARHVQVQQLGQRAQRQVRQAALGQLQQLQRGARAGVADNTRRQSRDTFTHAYTLSVKG